MTDSYYDSENVKQLVDFRLKEITPNMDRSKMLTDINSRYLIDNQLTETGSNRLGKKWKRNQYQASDTDTSINAFRASVLKASKVEIDKTISRRDAMKEINTLLENLPRYEVSTTQLYPLCSEEIRKLSVITINNFSKESGMTHGLSDSRMGSVTPREICPTCNRDDQGCGGHMGRIELPYKIINPLFKKEVIWTLQCICPFCGDTYIDQKFYDALCLDKVPKKKLLKVVAELSEKWLWKLHNHGTPKVVYRNDFNGPKLLFHYDVKADEKKVDKIISSETMRIIFNAVPDEKYKLLGYIGSTRPSNFLLETIPCCPPHIRPPSIVNGKAMDHPLTERYINIMKSIIRLQEEKIGSLVDRDTEFASLYEYIEMLAFGPEKKTGVNIPLKESGILPGLKTKKGFIRGHMMGKRVNKVGRTVGGPGFDINIGEIKIPIRHMSKILMVPDVVNEYNYNKVLKKYKNGHYKFKIMKIYSEKGIFPITKEHLVSYVPMIGDILLRHVEEGDRVLGGRQPSLHAESILAFNAVPNKWDTAKIHSSNNHCFNADFDGDEFSFHILQDCQAMAEADTVMNFKYHIMNQQSNKPMMALAFHGLIGSFLMTAGWMINGRRTEVTIPSERFEQAISLVGDSYRKSSLKSRVIRHNIPEFSGRALFSICLPTNFTYSGSGLEIIDGILIKGTLNKANIGLKCMSLVQVICKMYSIKEAARFINDAQKIADWFTMWHGLSLGYRDFNANRKEVIKMLKKDLNKMQIEFFNLGPRPKDEISFFFWMRALHGIVDKTKINGKTIGEKYLSDNNCLNILSEDKGCGAKGSLSNTSQITGSLGMQFVGPNIPSYDIKGKTRCLPFFPSNDVSLESIGYVVHSYMDQISPIDSMFHEMASRITLIDTARNVSDVGYSHRRIIKALESIVISWLGMVSSVDGRMFQPIFGAGFDIGKTIPVTSKKFGERIFFCDFKAEAKLLNRIHERKMFGDDHIVKHKTVKKLNFYEKFRLENGKLPTFRQLLDE